MTIFHIGRVRRLHLQLPEDDQDKWLKRVGVLYNNINKKRRATRL